MKGGLRVKLVGRLVLLAAVTGTLGVGCATLGVQPGRAASVSSSGGIRLVQQGTVPGEGSAFTDVRWATASSVYLARAFHGVIEVELANQPKIRRQVVPASDKLRPSARIPESTARLAVSDQYMVLASELGNLTWRKIESGGTVHYTHKPIAIADDVDVWRDRVILLGLPRTQERTEDGSIVPQGAIAWLGSLAQGLEDFKPVLFDAGGPRAPHLLNGAGLGLGSVRFFADGSFLVVPGFQPGAHLFSAAGKQVRAWSAEDTGLTTDTSTMTSEQSLRMRGTLESVYAWVNRYRSLDDVIALPEGPGLLVRQRDQDGWIRWELRVLLPQGVVSYSIPIQSRLPHSKLHADFRAGQIAFLLHSARFNGKGKEDLEGYLFVAELHQGKEGHDEKR